jgi:hypothetical protein
MRVNVPHLTFKGLRSAVGRDSRVNGDAQSFVQTFYIYDPFEIHKCERGDYIYTSSMQEIKEYRGRNIKNNNNNIHSSTQTHARTQSVREKKEQKGEEKKMRRPVVDRSFTREQQS